MRNRRGKEGIGFIRRDQHALPMNHPEWNLAENVCLCVNVHTLSWEGKPVVRGSLCVYVGVCVCVKCCNSRAVLPSNTDGREARPFRLSDGNRFSRELIDREPPDSERGDERERGGRERGINFICHGGEKNRLIVGEMQNIYYV